jgi:hypothetical protein
MGKPRDQMIREFEAKARRQGKTQITVNLVKLAIMQNKSMFLATSDIDFWYRTIRETFPTLLLVIENGGIAINRNRAGKCVDKSMRND